MHKRALRPEDATEEPPSRAFDLEDWGDLPAYLNFLKGRGSNQVLLRERYREFFEAYVKRVKRAPPRDGG